MGHFLAWSVEHVPCHGKVDSHVPWTTTISHRSLLQGCLASCCVDTGLTCCMGCGLASHSGAPWASQSLWVEGFLLALEVPNGLRKHVGVVQGQLWQHSMPF